MTAHGIRGSPVVLLLIADAFFSDRRIGRALSSVRALGAVARRSSCLTRLTLALVDISVTKQLAPMRKNHEHIPIRKQTQSLMLLSGHFWQALSRRFLDGNNFKGGRT